MGIIIFLLITWFIIGCMVEYKSPDRVDYILAWTMVMIELVQDLVEVV